MEPPRPPGHGGEFSPPSWALLPRAPVAAATASAGAAAGAEQQRQKKKMKRMPRFGACVACRKLKARCDGQMPCARCFKRGITCVPQPPDGGVGTTEPSASTTEPSASTSTNSGGAPLLPTTQTLAATAEAAQQVAAGASLHEAQPVGLAFLKSDPRPVVELMVRCFLKRARAPGAHRVGVVDMIRQWYLRGLACGADVSWGAMATCMREMGVDQAELEGPRAVGLDATVEQRRAQLLAGLHTGAAADGSALLLQAFGPPSLVDGTHVACFIHFSRPEDPLGLHVMASNKAFHQLFYSKEHLNDAFLHKRTAHLILSALLVAPADREEFFDVIFDVLFSATPRRRVMIGRGFARDGRIRLYIMEAKPARLGPDGTPHGIALKFEVCPRSRHVTTGARKPCSRLDFFRRDKKGASEAAAGDGGKGGGSGGNSSSSRCSSRASGVTADAASQCESGDGDSPLASSAAPSPLAPNAHAAVSASKGAAAKAPAMPRPPPVEAGAPWLHTVAPGSIPFSATLPSLAGFAAMPIGAAPPSMMVASYLPPSLAYAQPQPQQQQPGAGGRWIEAAAPHHQPGAPATAAGCGVAAEAAEEEAAREGGGAIPLFVAATAAAPSPRELFGSHRPLLPSPALLAPPDLDDHFLEAVFDDDGGGSGDAVDLLWDGGGGGGCGGDVFAF